MSKFDQLVSDLTKSAKDLGFKKRKLVWFKPADQLTVIFAIQKSQYDPNVWYYQFGICLHEIAKGSVTSIAQCQILYRMDHVYQGQLVNSEKKGNLIGKWDSMYGSLPKLRKCAIEGTVSGFCSAEARRYLTSNPWINGVFPCV